MTKGGERPGAGRPKGSKNKLNIHDHFEKDVKEFIEFLKANYMEDTKLMIWLGDHLFGKAAQEVDVTSGGKPLLISSNDDE